MKHISGLSLAALALAMAVGMGCDDAKPKDGTDAPVATEAAKTAAPAETGAAKTTDKAADKDQDKAGAAKAAPADAMSVKDLQDKFKADNKALLGKSVKVKGLYLNTNRTKSGGTETVSLSIVESKDDTKTSTSCQVTEVPDGLVQYDAVVVEGTVEKLFGASLKDCKATKL